MKFGKPALSLPDQIDLLIRRGMQIGDRDRAFQQLQHISYYRLRAYWLPQEIPAGIPGEHSIKPGTDFEDILDLYSFDRKLRLLVMDAIERIEVSLRARWGYVLATRHSPHSYENPHLFRDRRKHAKCLESLDAELQRSQEKFVLHYRKTYTYPVRPPVWAVSEVMSLGQLSMWFGNLSHNADRIAIAKAYTLDEQIIQSFFHHLTYVRNVCAHHSRLWNRELTIGIRMPKRPESLARSFNGERPKRLYNTLVMLGFMLDVISPGTRWHRSLVKLLDEHPKVDIGAMGFAKDWKQRPAWSL